ncbi:heart- and neural crest derivatives-expressed protein 2-like [Oratosquilla oratoria]|uniref:heart- and neural crest derivatives-expressed protein 2-like n=1 Tax=Oratosquilla oratoria TaxID=337810 RepID=UPI003F75A8D1
MSLVGGYAVPQSYGPGVSVGATPSPEALYSPYYSHPSPPQPLYPAGWSCYSPGYSPDMGSACPDYGVTGGFVVTPGSPHDLGGHTEYTIEMVDGCGRVVKRRSSANKKERRRTLSINNAFAELRECIPNVPADTKLSKIKTLRLATSYIAYLMDVLRSDGEAAAAQTPEAFKAELPPRPRNNNVVQSEIEKASAAVTATSCEERNKKGRTGWPQAVWAQELKK